MKWLIFLALISCGKHHQPKAVDLRDTDGDQVLNYQESEELNKYVANFEHLGTVKGVIKVNVNETLEIPFSNESDLGTKVPSLLVSNQDRIKNEEYFSEWTKIRLTKEFNLSELKKDEYTTYIQFETDSDASDEVILINGKFSKSLGKWNPEMKVTLKADELKKIIDGNAELRLKKKFKTGPLFDVAASETIKRKTYRVHWSDGKKAKVFYVSNELSFKDFQRLMKIESEEIISEDKIFFERNELDSPHWMSRELINGDKVLAFTDMKSLWNVFLTKYERKMSLVSRENGFPKTTLKLNNAQGANVYMIVRNPTKVMRNFEERVIAKSYGEGGGGREGNASTKVHCKHRIRSIKNEYPTTTDLYDFFGMVELMKNSNGPEYTERQDESGKYYEMRIVNIPENSVVQLNPTQPESKVIIGEYVRTCSFALDDAYVSNTEAKLSYQVETFVEKI